MRKNVMTFALLAMALVMVLSACGPTPAPATHGPRHTAACHAAACYTTTCPDCHPAAGPHRHRGAFHFRHAPGRTSQ